MAGFRTMLSSAAHLCETAARRVSAARDALHHTGQADAVLDPQAHSAEQSVAARARTASAQLAKHPDYLSIGTVNLAGGESFPFLVPFGPHGHLCTDVDGRDENVAHLVRAAILHTLSHSSAGTVKVALIDTATLGAVSSPLQPLVTAGVITEVATDPGSVEVVLSAAEKHIRERISTQGAAGPLLLLAVASHTGLSKALLERIYAIARSGREHRVAMIGLGLPELPWATRLRIPGDGTARVANPPTAPVTQGDEFAAPVHLHPRADNSYLLGESQRLADRAKAATALTFADLVPTEPSSHDPAHALEVPIGRDASGEVRLRFDDATPHWLVAGRTGGGKTVFILDVLYGLASRYTPDDLALYLLDFKEGVSFSEFTPSERDATFIPHARVVGVESDRAYGLAVLRHLNEEMTRRSTLMKRHGVSAFSALREHETLPRIVAVADEFQVLLAGNDKLASEAVSLLENLARKGRSYGVHLVLASQTISGIEALYAKKDSIFGQFPMRIALPGAKQILDARNTAAEGIGLGQVVINTDGGLAGADRVVRFPNVESDIMAQLRARLVRDHPHVSPPKVFYGYRSVHVNDVLAEQPASPGEAFVGQTVSLDLSPARFTFDARPGRHLAFLGSDPAGADGVSAVAASLGPAATIWTVDFTGTAAHVEAHRSLTPAEFTPALAQALETGNIHILAWGLDAAGLDRNGQTALRTLLKQGPARGVHLTGWWRAMRRFIDDTGGSAGREDVAGNIVLNLPGTELTSHFGPSFSDWQPRGGRALFIDRHLGGTGQLIVPFTRKEVIA
ncbi:FtsK/SpoIIIE domain-containing protein [Natronoglycomyces albus]|uniref:TraM recognition domain-containing protein n=1 Tax=Natronoglycomyces albus TaxID=2811108 RepID=A0A895XV03_9ACTN|nr:FtsK/SpoIIIE domain-containing protein [Natronoglycomyces albus]QSB05478.1 TraM recognition domain-containing protein [Natronoglycomyces albus]